MITIIAKKGQQIIVDDLDAYLLDRSWSVGSHGYAYSKGVLMHRLIMKAKQGDGMHVDHINGEKLDNRRGNLRIVTPRTNFQNRHYAWSSSGNIGVSWDKKQMKWAAHITVNWKKKHLGYYLFLKDAVQARQDAAKKYFDQGLCASPFAKDTP